MWIWLFSTCICGAFGSQISGGEPPPTKSRPNLRSVNSVLYVDWSRKSRRHLSWSVYLSLKKNLSDLSDRSHQEENAGSCTLSTKCTAALCKEVHTM